ncbi:MAG TPA: hypothetical protein VGL53_10565 [Bryobacteraceae bacterium]
MEPQSSMRRTPPPRGPAVAIALADPDEPITPSWLRRAVRSLLRLVHGLH